MIAGDRRNETLSFGIEDKIGGNGDKLHLLVEHSSKRTRIHSGNRAIIQLRTRISRREINSTPDQEQGKLVNREVKRFELGSGKGK